MDEHLKKLGIEARDDVNEYAKDSTLLKYIEEEIERVNQSLARVQTVKKFTVLAKPFDVATGELTPTMKLKRKFILMKFAKEVEELYKVQS